MTCVRTLLLIGLLFPALVIGLLAFGLLLAHWARDYYDVSDDLD